MTSVLEDLGIGRSAASGYATLLVEEGYDTPDLLSDLSESEMQRLGFKKPHITRVLRSIQPF